MGAVVHREGKGRDLLLFERKKKKGRVGAFFNF